MPKPRDQRVGVFVDIQNMYYSAKQFYNQKVNFAHILNRAVSGRRLVRAIAYVIKADIKEEESFFDALEKIGYDVRSKDLQTFYGGAKKGDWDVGIAMDIMRMASKLDVVVLVSGDGDFKDLIEHVKALGCRAEVIAFRKTASSRIVNEADEFMDLDKDLEKVLIKDHHYNNKKPMEAFQKDEQVIAHGAVPEMPKAEVAALTAPHVEEQKKELGQKESFHKPENEFHKEGFQKPEGNFRKEGFNRQRPGFRKEGFNRNFQRRDGFQRREPFQRREGGSFERNEPVSLLQKLNMEQPLQASRPVKLPMPPPNLQKDSPQININEQKPLSQEIKKEPSKETKKPETKKKTKKEGQESILKKVMSKVTKKK